MDMSSRIKAAMDEVIAICKRQRESDNMTSKQQEFLKQLANVGAQLYNMRSQGKSVRELPTAELEELRLAMNETLKVAVPLKREKGTAEGEIVKIEERIAEGERILSRRMKTDGEDLEAAGEKEEAGEDGGGAAGGEGDREKRGA